MSLVIRASESGVIWTVQMSRSGPLGMSGWEPCFPAKTGSQSTS